MQTTVYANPMQIQLCFRFGQNSSCAEKHTLWRPGSVGKISPWVNEENSFIKKQKNVSFTRNFHETIYLWFL